MQPVRRGDHVSGDPHPESDDCGRIKGGRKMFGLFKKKKDKAHVLGAPAKGKAVSLKEVSDPTFSGRRSCGDSIRRQNLCAGRRYDRNGI